MTALLLFLTLLAPGDVISADATCTYADTGSQVYSTSANCQLVTVSPVYRETPVYACGKQSDLINGMLVRKLMWRSGAPECVDGIQLSNGSLWTPAGILTPDMFTR